MNRNKIRQKPTKKKKKRHKKAIESSQVNANPLAKHSSGTHMKRRKKGGWCFSKRGRGLCGRKNNNFDIDDDGATATEAATIILFAVLPFGCCFFFRTSRKHATTAATTTTTTTTTCVWRAKKLQLTHNHNLHMCGRYKYLKLLQATRGSPSLSLAISLAPIPHLGPPRHAPFYNNCMPHFGASPLFPLILQGHELGSTEKKCISIFRKYPAKDTFCIQFKNLLIQFYIFFLHLRVKTFLSAHL